MVRPFLGLILAGGMLTGGMAMGTAHAASKTHGMMSSNVMLGSLGGSGITGTAAFTYNSATKMTTVKLTIKHLKANSLHPAHIHMGRCGKAGAPGKVLYPFPVLKAGRNGIAVAKMSFPANYQHKMWAVNVHTGPGLAPASQYKVLACGNIM